MSYSHFLHSLKIMTTPLPRRTAIVNRITKETKIQVSLSLDGGKLGNLPNDEEFEPDLIPPPNTEIPAQNHIHHAAQISPKQHIWIWTGIGFLDHMLHAWAKHAGWSLRIRCLGDLASMTWLPYPPLISGRAHANPSLQLIHITPPKTLFSRSATPSTRPWAPGPDCSGSATRMLPWMKRFLARL